MPDLCAVTRAVEAQNGALEWVTTYPGPAALSNVPCRFGELAGQELVAAQAIDERISAMLTLAVGTDIRLTDQISVLSSDWRVAHVYEQHGYSTALHIGIFKEAA